MNNVMDELFWSVVVAASWGVGLGIKCHRRKPCLNHAMMGVLTSFLVWIVCALCAPWSFTDLELLIMGLFCVIINCLLVCHSRRAYVPRHRGGDGR